MPKSFLRLLPALLIACMMPTHLQGQDGGDSTEAPTSSVPAKPQIKVKKSRDRGVPRRSGRSKVSKAQQDKDHAEWLAKLKENGVEPWPEDESAPAHAEALTKSREMVADVVENFPGTQLFETDHFLFVSNIPRQQVAPYIASLDRMYDWMCQLYGVPRDHKVWLGGKAPIFAFLEHDQFSAFEDRFYPEARESFHTLANIYGLSHLNANGEVVISCYRGNDPNDFAQMLIHETSHGFIHRYKTKVRLPNWVDEGMADLIGAELVPASTAVKNREIQALQTLSQRPALGGMFKAERIEAWQYGVASNLSRFMLQSNRENYVRFIENLKAGDKWEAALKDAYGGTPEQLLESYARAIHVAGVQP
jgi:hypothetical protein